MLEGVSSLHSLCLMKCTVLFHDDCWYWQLTPHPLHSLAELLSVLYQQYCLLPPHPLHSLFSPTSLAALIPCTLWQSCSLFSPNSIGCSLLIPCTLWQSSSLFSSNSIGCSHSLHSLCSLLLPVMAALSSSLDFSKMSAL